MGRIDRVLVNTTSHNSQYKSIFGQESSMYAKPTGCNFGGCNHFLLQLQQIIKKVNTSLLQFCRLQVRHGIHQTQIKWVRIPSWKPYEKSVFLSFLASRKHLHSLACDSLSPLFKQGERPISYIKAYMYGIQKMVLMNLSTGQQW